MRANRSSRSRRIGRRLLRIARRAARAGAGECPHCHESLKLNPAAVFRTESGALSGICTPCLRRVELYAGQERGELIVTVEGGSSTGPLTPLAEMYGGLIVNVGGSRYLSVLAKLCDAVLADAAHAGRGKRAKRGKPATRPPQRRPR